MCTEGHPFGPIFFTLYPTLVKRIEKPEKKGNITKMQSENSKETVSDSNMHFFCTWDTNRYNAEKLNPLSYYT